LGAIYNDEPSIQERDNKAEVEAAKQAASEGGALAPEAAAEPGAAAELDEEKVPDGDNKI